MVNAVAIAGGMFADAGYGHMDGFGWGMMGLGWLVMLVIVGLVVWVIVQASSGSSPRKHDPTASGQQILADRYARGEIDEDEYRRRSSELRS